MEKREDYRNLESALGHSFRDQHLLIQALTHRSASETALASNERMEFLGDSVLQLTVSTYLYRKFPHFPEGELAKIRALLVREQALAEVARKLRLNKFLKVGRGEQRLQAQELDSLLSDALEAVYGAVYLDGGFSAVEDVILSHLPQWDQREIFLVDAKTTLQEHFQLVAKKPPSYEVVAETGPDHAKTFVIQVRFEEEILGEGRGHTKKEAAQEAARQALAKLEIQEGQ
ncbi:MAG: ribonuclease III [Firmicutes bacterium]|nr:ribonuclease III [Bacillota bacterium]